MEWRRWQWAQYKAAIFAAVLLAVVLTVLVWFPANVKNTTAGFGPDWECTHQPTGDPICIKKVRP
jgi:hypothetical protein